MYGSDNGGKTVVSKNQRVTEIMEYFAQKLNLKAHAVSGVRLFTPGDLEAHHGFDDKDYIVDTSNILLLLLLKSFFNFVCNCYFFSNI